jgi:hypothetical protein
LARLRFPLLALLLASLVAAAGGSARTHAAASAPTQVFVLAGQSNMLGRGKPLTLASPTDPRLQIWRTSAWQLASDPLGGGDNGIGPGMTFGLSLLDLEPGETVGLVMCAKGSTSIADWLPDAQAYRKCIAQARASGGPVAGVLFLQGETDAQSSTAARSWKQRFQRVHDAFEADLGGNVPFVLGQIGRIKAGGFGAQDEVRRQQAAAADANPGMPLVTTLDLPVGSDGIHFTVESYRTIGTRFANAWWDAVDGSWTGTPGGASAPPAPEEAFVLAGGTNMAGKGKPLSEALPMNPSVQIRRDGIWQVANDPLSLKTGGIGPGMSFGSSLLQADPDTPVGLIMCAKASSSIDDWQPGGDLYRACVSSARAAGVPIAGILFHEGERDAQRQGGAGAWAAKFERIVDAFHDDLGAGVPIVLGQIGTLDKGEYKYQVKIRAQQQLAADERSLPLVTTTDLPVAGDGSSFTVDGYETLGSRLAAAWQAAS